MESFRKNIKLLSFTFEATQNLKSETTPNSKSTKKNDSKLEKHVGWKESIICILQQFFMEF